MTYNPKTKRKHGAAMLVGPGMVDIHLAWREINRKAEEERNARQKRIAQRKSIHTHLNPQAAG